MNKNNHKHYNHNEHKLNKHKNKKTDLISKFLLILMFSCFIFGIFIYFNCDDNYKLPEKPFNYSMLSGHRPGILFEKSIYCTNKNNHFCSSSYFSAPTNSNYSYITNTITNFQVITQIIYLTNYLYIYTNFSPYSKFENYKPALNYHNIALYLNGGMFENTSLLVGEKLCSNFGFCVGLSTNEYGDIETVNIFINH